MRNTLRKYRNSPTEYCGVKYASKAEARYAAELDLRVRAKEIVSWRRQVKIPLRIGSELIANYVVDFEITHRTGELEYVECKGYETPEWRIKWRLFEVLWPETRKLVVR